MPRTYGHYSTGAADDLSRATDIARDMVTRYAMLPGLGSASYADSDSVGFLGSAEGLTPRRYSEDTAREIDLAVRNVVDGSFNRAVELLRHNRSVLEASARALLDQETLDEAQLVAFFERLEPVLNPAEPTDSGTRSLAIADEAMKAV